MNTTDDKPKAKTEVRDKFVQKALAAMQTAVPKAEKDSTRPVFHFRPPAQWMNDVCGALFYKGWYHIFFQFHPWSDQPNIKIFQKFILREFILRRLLPKILKLMRMR